MPDSTVCEKCSQPLNVGDWPFCPHGTGNANVITDEIPGGVYIKHGLCFEDGTPRKFYSKSAIREAAFQKGLFQGTDTPKANPRLQDLNGAKRDADKRRSR
jgi:hypothetical protein